MMVTCTSRPRRNDVFPHDEAEMNVLLTIFSATPASKVALEFHSFMNLFKRIVYKSTSSKRARTEGLGSQGVINPVDGYTQDKCCGTSHGKESSRQFSSTTYGAGKRKECVPVKGNFNQVYEYQDSHFLMA